MLTEYQTKELQDSLVACGWEQAGKTSQQDVSEAFTRITDILEFPLLELKMDVYHTGKDDNDDHRIVRERLLDVAIPPPPADGSAIRLEDCLENYFNNKIEVKRQLQRRNTVQSIRPEAKEKGEVIQVEAVEVDSKSLSKVDSIFSRRKLKLRDVEEPTVIAQDDIALHHARKGFKPPKWREVKEVSIPAWQFFNLIPWPTHQHQRPQPPTTDEQIVRHFSSSRPVLGICLKRYNFTPGGPSSKGGSSNRLQTYVDIPLEAGFPHFIADDSAPEDGWGSSFRNFKVSLQSVICHRGSSIAAGHYIALVRPSANEPEPADAAMKDIPAKFRWLIFDDLQEQSRVKYIDVRQALKAETPYLVFYQVIPINGDTERFPHPSDLPPTYAEATSTTTTAAASVANTDLASEHPSTTISTIPSRSEDGVLPTQSTLPSMLDVGMSPKILSLIKSDPTIPKPLADAANRPHSIDLASLPHIDLADQSETSSSIENRASVENRISIDSHGKRRSVIFTDSSTGGLTPGEDLPNPGGYISSKEHVPMAQPRRVSDSAPKDKDSPEKGEKRSGRGWLSVRSRSRPVSQPGENRENRLSSYGSGLVKGFRGAMSRDKLVDKDATNSTATEDESTEDSAAAAPSTGPAPSTATPATGEGQDSAAETAAVLSTAAKPNKFASLGRKKSMHKGKGRERSRARGEEENGKASNDSPDRQCAIM
jgi:hypothetical protein